MYFAQGQDCIPRPRNADNLPFWQIGQPTRVPARLRDSMFVDPERRPLAVARATVRDVHDSAPRELSPEALLAKISPMIGAVDQLFHNASSALGAVSRKRGDLALRDGRGGGLVCGCSQACACRIELAHAQQYLLHAIHVSICWLAAGGSMSGLA